MGRGGGRAEYRAGQVANEVGMGDSPGSPVAFSEGEEGTEDGSGGVGEGTGQGGVTGIAL